MKIGRMDQVSDLSIECRSCVIGNVVDRCIHVAAHGGFLTSLLWKSIFTHFQTTLAKSNQPDIVSLHVEFLRLAGLGDATVSITDTRLGKRSSTVHAVLSQDGKERVAAYATYAISRTRMVTL